jgi:hypothetical protein
MPDVFSKNTVIVNFCLENTTPAQRFQKCLFFYCILQRIEARTPAFRKRSTKIVGAERNKLDIPTKLWSTMKENCEMVQGTAALHWGND